MLSAAILKAATIPARMKMHRAHGIRHVACIRKEVQMLLISLSAHLPIFLFFFCFKCFGHAMQHVGS